MNEFPISPSSPDKENESTRKEIVVDKKAVLPDRIRIRPEKTEKKDSKD